MLIGALAGFTLCAAWLLFLSLMQPVDWELRWQPVVFCLALCVSAGMLVGYFVTGTTC